MPVGRPRADRQLAPCREVGLTCHECVRQSAQQLAQISEGLSAGRVRQMFNALYPAPNCLPMAGAFVQIVLEQQGSSCSARRPLTAQVLPARVHAAVA
ncbi:MAG: hypothetical protein M9913_07315 [Bryobacteraceae bacterium]|nr:hypothetical protein [Solibacteraceae bacterium]MCL4841305.1 hypothetical protein [Bryobacteraceae bacterium]MCO5350692.1 hypothetical protein [Bryobacteraceae bacterium]HAX45126.1 hypothetical protein [Bryobacterales bacterium]HRJ17695.1 hypothetical protein [Bryobacteraceae bacterium]